MNVWTAPWSTFMQLETKYLRLCTAVTLGSRFGPSQPPACRVRNSFQVVFRLPLRRAGLLHALGALDAHVDIDVLEETWCWHSAKL
jgi:hypothetical protein